MGWKRGPEDEDLTGCQRCEPNYMTLANGSKSCSQCEVGKHGNKDNVGFCVPCEAGLYQDTKGQGKCKQCMDKSKIPTATACEKSPWKIKEDCKLGKEYLDDTSPNKTDHSCETCIFGADCSEFSTISSLRPKKGYKAMSWDNRTFGACLLPDACNGTCIEGHSGELCTECISGWATTSKQRTLCAKCPNGLQLSYYSLEQVASHYSILVLGVGQFKWRSAHGAHVRATATKCLLHRIHCL